MFYKEDYLTKEEKNFFNNSPEFIYELYQKMSVVPHHYLGAFVAIDKDGIDLMSIPSLLYKGLDEYTDNGFSGHINIEGAYGLSQYSYESILENFQKENENTINFKIMDLPEEEYKKRFVLNENKLIKAKEVLNDFFILKEQGIIKDKNGEVYHFKIINNSDPSIGSNLILDELYLFKEDGTFIGYLKVKYTTNEILEKLKIDEKERKNEVFLNVAGVDFSRIKEDYHHLGLGYAMYFHMTQYLNKNDIEFRQSSLNSDKAERLWNGINRHFAEFIEQKMFGKKILSFLKIGEDCVLSFENNKPIITNKNKM